MLIFFEYFIDFSVFIAYNKSVKTLPDASGVIGGAQAFTVQGKFKRAKNLLFFYSLYADIIEISPLLQSVIASTT